MQEWVVVDQFGNVIAQGFYDKQSAELYAQNIPNASVELRDKFFLSRGLSHLFSFLFSCYNCKDYNFSNKGRK
ncbi:hypothetical protein ACMZ6Y_09625 [Streptococcus pluranimalium]|uniref:hypothetical protein n=1 Tax=Streptococcus hyovaginalis TaxID=149015 RepID=UPI00055E3741|nr:hypothetical protein [Streptococcus hyovaginalis]MDY3024047.1 hypothetical protein [Streptococcus hyovaginalis]MDY4510568.1 hypothetical protein [Streptococcus hyovaginalis]MDY5974090.1 hypothetical protein [Streptococcus hyovaginalis]